MPVIFVPVVWRHSSSQGVRPSIRRRGIRMEDRFDVIIILLISSKAAEVDRYSSKTITMSVSFSNLVVATVILEPVVLDGVEVFFFSDLLFFFGWIPAWSYFLIQKSLVCWYKLQSKIVQRWGRPSGLSVLCEMSSRSIQVCLLLTNPAGFA